jgi:L-ascorbate metabolism protein UlaG (beta-lactamase superfamily)
MELTKHAHACVTLDKAGGHLLVDPGAFASDVTELLAGTSTVLITHEHFDHFDEAAVTAALDTRPELRVFAPAAVAGRWPGRESQVTAVAPGDRFQAEGFEIAVFGGVHALVHADIPRIANVGYLIDDAVYHPGDSYEVPSAAVHTLLVPTSGPWTKMAETVDFVRAVRPETMVQIHDIMLSEIGQQSAAMLLSPKMLTKTALTILPVGETMSL